MKRFVISMYVCCCAVFCSCSDDDKLPDVRPAAKGEYTDVRDGNTYGWVRIGDLEWMTENLKYQVGGLPYYECTYDVFGANYPVAVRSQLINTDFEADYETYGNFYTWQEAVESCPEGWRLPTDEDWKNLEMALGMSAGDANAEGWRGSREATLLQQINDEKRKLDIIKERLEYRSPIMLIDQKLQLVDSYLTSALLSIQRKLDKENSRFFATAARLDALSPLKVMSRGYSIVTKDEKVVISSKKLKKGDRITVGFADGEKNCEVL